MKRFFFAAIFFFFLLLPSQVYAQNISFVTIVNPVRGEEFWEQNQEIETAVIGQINILDKSGLQATWLIRFDALANKEVKDTLKKRADEKGLFLEVTPGWAKEAQVAYRKSDIWHNAGSAFLTGYEPYERKKLIDAAFLKFKNTFGFFPVSVGAWWIDSYSLGYMQERYGVSAALVVADQFSTDNYQIWGQYFGTPYYPVKNNALHPAQTSENKLDVVVMQWAARDPVNSYGNGVTESTFSVQANDYKDYHNLDIKYFSQLVDIYTKQRFNQFGHIVVGLENSYDWSKYSVEYENQMKTLAEKQNSKQFSVVTMKDFADWYKDAFPEISPPQLIVADDPLGGFNKTVWFMNPYYRAGWFAGSDGSVFRDIRQYIEGEEELCLRTRCDSVNFATSATRVLDKVSFGDKWLIDQGKINDFKTEKKGESILISYNNEAGNTRKIELLPRDIAIDGKILSIDAAILNATEEKADALSGNPAFGGLFLKWSPVSVVFKSGVFLIFFIIAVILPGMVLTGNIIRKEDLFLRIFISSAAGIGALTLLFYLVGLIKFLPIVFIYILVSFVFFIRLGYYRMFADLPRIKKDFNLIIFLIILGGTVFQVIPVLRSGLNFGYGLGFWGPNTHDGIWHIALINQLIRGMPPENPIFAGAVLKNYHFFYDVLIAATNYLSRVPVADLVFRFYPVVFSLMLGTGSYYLMIKIFGRMADIKIKASIAFGLYLVYFAGSFGWIVEFLREKHFGGESAFWVNQAVSFNLNPPFAVSLVMLIAIFQLLFQLQKKGVGSKIITAVLIGILASFKSYTGVLVLSALSAVAVVAVLRNRNFVYFWMSLFSASIAVLLFLSNFQASSALIIFAPFWFIHSMVDSPDRVGWVRLSLARTASYSLGQWPKFIAAETLSIFIFILGNLGLRLFALGSLLRIKEIFRNDGALFIFTLTILSISIPILFIQSGNPWNTIQFFYPALYITALLSGPVIATIVFRMNIFSAFIFISIIIVFVPVNSFVTANGYLGKTPHAFVSSKELAGLQFLATQPDGVVLTYPFDEKIKAKIAEPRPLLAYDSTAYVSALSNKAAYLEDYGQNQILLTDYKKRVVSSYDFFDKPLINGQKFLIESKIEYIYIPKIFHIRLDESAGVVKNIFENEEVVIYGVII